MAAGWLQVRDFLTRTVFWETPPKMANVFSLFVTNFYPNSFISYPSDDSYFPAPGHFRFKACDENSWDLVNSRYESAISV